MKARPDKFLFLLSDTGCQAMDVCSEKIENSDCKKVYFFRNILKTFKMPHIQNWSGTLRNLTANNLAFDNLS